MDRTNLHNDHENDGDYSDDHDGNEPVKEKIGEDAMESKKSCQLKSICEATKPLVHIRRESSKRLVRKLFRFL